jgi:adenine C2-methylase RlmN of 23S rRNA A2503 and tRNA A37
MEVYRTKDNSVAKYVHDDGSETSIKTSVESCGGTYGTVNNKYNVFISTSVGCQVGCDFCYLTVKKCPYIKLSSDTIVSNVIEAIKKEIAERPELKDMYTKLSWMGMGDAVVDIDKMEEVTIRIIHEIQDGKLSKGIDGVDVSTTFPIVRKSTFITITNLNSTIRKIANLNPKRLYSDTNSPLRVFYSLHSAVESTRRVLIPTGASINRAIEVLDVLYKSGITTIIHHMFFNGVNDTEVEIAYLEELLQTLNGIELRILRFNKCEGTNYKESINFYNIVDRLCSKYHNIKVQASPGSEVKAACGQFLLSRIIK